MSTRAATRQQELEEQLVELIGMMGQQQERQEQQQERQEAKLIGMMEQQRERQEQLASEQRQWQKELAHQQEQQLEQLVGKQWKVLEKKQLEAEQQVEALQYDLGRTKDAVEGRFQTAEGWLAELQTSHRVLAEEMRESQASLREEVQTKLETLQSVEKKSSGTTLSPSLRASAVELEETRTSQASVKQERLTNPESSEEKPTGSASFPPLRASAVEFIPTVNSFLAGADDGIHRTCTGGGVLQRPPPYDGRSSLEAYRAQFEMLSQLNHWTETEKATLLAVSLRGAALTVLSNLTRERRGDYRALVIAMEKRFGADQIHSDRPWRLHLNWSPAS